MGRGTTAVCGVVFLVSAGTGLVALARSTDLDSRRSVSAGQEIGQAPADGVSARNAENLVESLGISFEANTGQHDPEVRYLARGQGSTAFFTDRGPVFALLPETPPVGPPASPGTALRMELHGAQNVVPEGRERLTGTVNYFLGQDHEAWNVGVPTFGAIVYRDVYPGIDLRFRSGPRGALEYDFMLTPGADPDDISMSFAGSDALRLDEHGDLVITTPAGEVVHRAPFIYQPTSRGRVPVAGRFDLRGTRVGFTVGGTDPSLPLVVDPLTDLLYSTFLGGSGSDEGTGIAVDGSGNIYVTGSTSDAGTDLPTTAGAFDTSHNGDDDAFVAKIVPAGAGTADLAYSTYLGGSGRDVGRGIAVDGSGAAYIVGETDDAATDFPTTTGAFDTSHNGGAGEADAFVAKVVPAGGGATDLAYSTFLGGSSAEEGSGIDLDSFGNAYVTGTTTDGATDLPTTTGAFNTTHNGFNDAFVAKVAPAGGGPTDLVYATFLGGSGFEEGNAVAVDGSGNAYVTGETSDDTTDLPTTTGAFNTSHNGDLDAFLTKLAPAGGGATDLLYSTFLGGSSEDLGRAIAVDGSGNAFVAGDTSDAATDFPTTPGTFDASHNGVVDAFVAKVVPSGGGAADLAYSTLLGGGDFDGGFGIAVGAGAAYVTGYTTDDATDFPTTPGAFDTTHNGGVGEGDAFVAKVVPAGGGTTDLAESTFLGGSGDDSGSAIAVDGSENVYVTGYATDDATDLPTTAGAFATSQSGVDDAFVAKLGGSPPPPPAPPAPGPAAPSGKQVGLTSSKAKVKKGKNVTFTAVVSPCAGHEGDLVEFERNGTDVASVTSDASCRAQLTVKIRRKATWQARSPQQDSDHTEGLSSSLTVKVKKPKS